MTHAHDIKDVRFAKISRRSFIASSSLASCYVAFALSGCSPGQPEGGSGNGAEKSVNAWVTFKDNGIIEITTPCIELGQGAMTTLALYVAEELDADWKDVRVVQATHDDKRYGNAYFYGWQITAGSRTALGYFDVLRVGGAQARHMLLTAAAGLWSVPLKELTTEKSVVFHKTASRQIPYADLIPHVIVPAAFPDFVDPDFQQQPSDLYFGPPPASMVKPGDHKANALSLKRRSEYKLIGVDTPRVDIPAKSRGQARYGMDAHRDGMLYGMVEVSPQVGGVPLKVDDSAARAVKGIVDVITLPYGVAVVGTDIFSVREARKLLQISWRDASTFPKYDSAATLDDFAKIARSGKNAVRPFIKGDESLVTAAFSGKHVGQLKVVVFETQAALVYHATMEPQNALVIVAPDKQSAQVWVGTQMPLVDAVAVAGVVGIAPEKVQVTAIQTGGAFGRRAEAGAVIDAAHLSSKLGKPVKVIWTREDDFRRNPHRQAMACRMEAAIDGSGKIIATRHRVVADSWLARTQPEAFKNLGGADAANWMGAVHNYDIPNHVVDVFTERRAVDVCYMRGIGVQQTKFCEESLIDKIALERGEDPLEFRLALLQGSPRGQAVLREVARMSQWSSDRAGRQLGVAYAEYSGAHGALVAEISLNKSSGEIKVHKAWFALDVGLPIQPDGIVSQVEGAILMSMSITLKEQVAVKDSVMQASNFHNYPILRMSEVPEIEVKVLPTNNPIAGASEMGMYHLAPAINSAIARLTGKHMMKLPMLPSDVLKAINA